MQPRGAKHGRVAEGRSIETKM